MGNPTPTPITPITAFSTVSMTASRPMPVPNVRMVASSR